MKIQGNNYLRLARDELSEIKTFINEYAIDHNVDVAEEFENKINIHSIEMPIIDFWNTIVWLVNGKIDLQDIKDHFCIEDNEPLVEGGILKFEVTND